MTSTTSKAIAFKTPQDNIQILQNNYGQLANLLLRRGQSSLPAAVSLGGTSINISDKIARLATQGDTMIGPLALEYSIVTIGTVNSTPNSIDVGISSANYNSILNVFPASGATGQLDYIYGDQFPYQILILQSIHDVSYSINITNNGNIITLTGSTMTLSGRDMWIFMFDPGLNAWRQITAGRLSVGSGGANTTLSNLTSPTAINQNLIPALLGPNPTSFSLGTSNAPWNSIFGLTLTLYQDLSILTTNFQLFINSNPGDHSIIYQYTGINGTSFGHEFKVNGSYTFSSYVWANVSNTNLLPGIDLNFDLGGLNPFNTNLRWRNLLMGGYQNLTNIGSEPAAPISGDIRMYTIVSAGVQYLVIKWSDGTKTVLASH